MISKNQIKLITSLQQKKYRQLHQLFIAEGVKVIQELLESNFELEHLYITEPIFNNCKKEVKTTITSSEMERISCLKTPSNSLALFKIINIPTIEEKGLIVALDDIRDPGNLGTIIRLCDWFGIEQLWCSQETVDVYNPKVVQSTMGSISRVNVNYFDLATKLKNTKLPIFGTFMEGENVYKSILPSEGIIILGNEANGISKEVEKIIQKKLSIPRFGSIQKTESLNVATAAAIILSEFKRIS